MYHSFHLLSIENASYDDYHHPYLQEGIYIPADWIDALSDTHFWIPTYNPARREASYGLAGIGPTVIRLEGAEIAYNVFSGWINLLNYGPEILTLRGAMEIDVEARKAEFSEIKVDKVEFITKLNKLSIYAQQIIDTNGKFFIFDQGLIGNPW